MSLSAAHLLILLGLAALLPPGHARSISVNMAVLPTTDAQRVDAGESSVSGIAGAESVDGANWNNIPLRTTSAAGDPTVFRSSTQGGNRIRLKESTGADSPVEMTSAGTFYASFANTSSPNTTGTGDAALMHGYLVFNSSESISLAGLAAWAPYGYKVYAFFDIGAVTRTYGVSMTDGTVSQIFWTADSTTDADVDNNGVIEWQATAAATSGSAVADANYAVFGDFTGDTLTISGDTFPLGTRAVLSGFQIVANPGPPLATIASFTATPDTFAAGQSVTLSWEVLEADSVSIDPGVGPVAASGSVVVDPAEATTWTLTALRGGIPVTATASASFTVGSVSVNFSPLPTIDAEAVDPGETSVVGIPGTEAIDGGQWNNVRLRPTATSGTPTNFIAATQGGNRIDLISSLGSDSGVNLTSASAATGLFSNYGNSSNPNSANTGDGGLMQGILLLDRTESVTLDGLAAWAPNGYRVHAFFDIGNATRTYGLTMGDGTRSQTFWTADTPTDADANNDGVIDWLQTTATTPETAVPNANRAVFGLFTGDILTLSGAGTSGRSALSGFQIVRNTAPIATIASFTVTPAVFSPGESVTLSWNVQNADSISIDQGVGTVSPSGSAVVTPAGPTKWTLSAIRGGTTLTADVTATQAPAEIDVYLLGGQSNMQGTALTTALTPAQLAVPGILLYTAGSGVNGTIANQLVPLQPANGSTFGLEIGIGERLRGLRPGRSMAFIKYAASGTSLEIGWKPGANNTDTANWGPQYSAFVTTVNSGIAALQAAGWTPVIRGMGWQQGEQDAKDGLDAAESDTSADDYGANLSAFIGRVRQQFAAHAGPGGIRFVPGQVLPYAPPGGDVDTRFPGRGLVRQAILDVDENSGSPLSVANTEAVPTNEVDHPSHEQEVDGYRDDDEVHQNAPALIAIGRSMAYALLDLGPQSYIDWSTGRGLVGGRGDDDDGDGLSNEQEYLFGGDPKLLSDAPRPGIQTGNGAARYVVPWNRAATELIPFAEFSPDLLDWVSRTPVPLPITELPDGTSLLNYEAPWQIGDPAHPRGFFRTRGVSP